jgi:hypothetical protein
VPVKTANARQNRIAVVIQIKDAIAGKVEHLVVLTEAAGGVNFLIKKRS